MKHKLSIGAYTWDLDDEVGDSEMEGCLGFCDYADLKITIKEKMNDQVRRATVLHELGHAFFASCGFDPKEEERVVDIYANQLLDFIQKNKEFFKSYFIDSKNS